MRKRKVYLDTSVVSYLNREDAPERMRDTLQLWELFRAFNKAVEDFLQTIPVRMAEERRK